MDDIYGADFVNGGKDGNIQDQNGHGTFVAGVVGAMTNNALGVVGINQVRGKFSAQFLQQCDNCTDHDAMSRAAPLRGSTALCGGFYRDTLTGSEALDILQGAGIGT